MLGCTLLKRFLSKLLRGVRVTSVYAVQACLRSNLATDATENHATGATANLATDATEHHATGATENLAAALL